MKSSIIHIMTQCLAALVLLLTVACGREEPSAAGEGVTTLLLDVSTIDATRSESADAMPDNEKMRSVRVVVLHGGDGDAKGTVEHNEAYPLDEAVDRKRIIVQVKSGERKKIFLFANEESVGSVEGVASAPGDGSLTAFLDSFGKGQAGFEEAVNGVYFAPDYSGGKPIPMSSMYEIDVPDKGNFEGTFHVVRVATKFTVNFLNWRGEDVVVEKFTIASHADRNFLMAHVEDTPANQALLNGKTWIDWLKGVSDASSENDDYPTTEAAGWLKDYGLPAAAALDKVYTHEAVTVKGAVIYEDDLDATKPGTAVSVPVFYLPESKCAKADATDGEQEYTMTLQIAGHTEPFVLKLPNLKALFRNTHVVVNITMYHNLQLSVDVIPFAPVGVLNPDYGLEREEFTGYIKGKDSSGNVCWYAGNYYDPEKAVPLYLGPKGNEENFVDIDGKKYLLVYTDYERTAAKLDHFFEKESRRKYLLTPEGITGYKYRVDIITEGDTKVSYDMYINNDKERVWLDFGGDPNGNADEKAVYEALQVVDLDLKCCRMLYEWDRLDWNRARWWGWKGIYPKYWFDVLGNRHPWSASETNEDRKALLGEWVQYLE